MRKKFVIILIQKFYSTLQCHKVKSESWQTRKELKVALELQMKKNKHHTQNTHKKGRVQDISFFPTSNFMQYFSQYLKWSFTYKQNA